MCRLGFHKWRNYGNIVEVFWQEPAYVKRDGPRPSGVLMAWHERHHKIVYEGRECKRCGVKLRCKFVTNSDGTLSCVGWEPDTEETDKE